ncbi:site-specific DNA-methyltransferase [Gemmata sp. G18]|uniref:site-specific DNA-methyltransferase (adenine-specific) n=1 Tax=Gemmata palustris TaxID=2822762 RepID=A0ABS5BQB1_9BACT|nr:site-specific DNA-methyltransferase [Gemmata palustris]MBP3955048.1 site-specific DNA-methyltransferase [Gemmata palustris]
MKPITTADPQSRSADLLADNVARLRELFPEAFTEGKIDFDVLKQLLGSEVDEREEKYGLNWHGKRLARRLALTPSTGTLRPAPEDSLEWSTTQNLMIEGDNLEVLKLLQKSYSGRVKMIFIDPPYNTGKDFVYPDDFRDSIENYKRLTGQTDGAGRALTSNPETSGRFHTDWLNMMFPRLKLARNLLREDGVLFISIDSTEVANLRLLCSDVFGEECFVIDLIWRKRDGAPNDRTIGSVHDHILVYGKTVSSTSSRSMAEDNLNLMPRTEKADAEYQVFKEPSGPDPKGPFRKIDTTLYFPRTYSV